VEPLKPNSPVGIVIPVHADLDALGALLGRITAWRDRPAEIVVVAAESSTELLELCARSGCRLIQCRANRGEQLDRGARATAAPILWFLHADAAPPEAALTAIRSAVEAGAAGGCLRFAFQGPPTWGKRAIERLVALRLRFGGIPYGDQCLFAQRAAYLAAGGFAHEPLFEEVGLVRGIRQIGPFRVLTAPSGVATRRWDRDGWWRRTWHNRWLALCHACGVSAQRLAKSYHSRRSDAQTRAD
jgi:rSAM/selenodomain-associated transferase 2